MQPQEPQPGQGWPHGSAGTPVPAWQTMPPGPPAPAGSWPPPVAPHKPGLSGHGRPGRHRLEIVLLVLVILSTVAIYAGSALLVFLNEINQLTVPALAAPLLVYFGRGTMWATQRVNGIRMSPTQFPEGYQLVAEAAARFGMRKPPDAYVVLGNGMINAFASGHGFRRYVVVYSDLFEIGGKAREPDALAFIIGHEVGHIAAGHASYWRQLGTFSMSFLPLLGAALSRSQEYTADNHGYACRQAGVPGAMGTLGAGKYLNSHVGFDELADRSMTERGFFVWLVNALATHPVLVWRAAALRDRTRHGRLLWRPRTQQLSPPAQQPAEIAPV